jgi:hypothetical protein
MILEMHDCFPSHHGAAAPIDGKEEALLSSPMQDYSCKPEIFLWFFSLVWRNVDHSNAQFDNPDSKALPSCSSVIVSLHDGRTRRSQKCNHAAPM